MRNSGMKKIVAFLFILSTSFIMGGRLPKETSVEVTIEDCTGYWLQELNKQIFKKQKINHSYLKIMSCLHMKILCKQNCSERRVLMVKYVCAYSKLTKRSFNNPVTRKQIIIENNGVINEMYREARMVKSCLEEEGSEDSDPTDVLTCSLIISDDILAHDGEKDQPLT